MKSSIDFVNERFFDYALVEHRPYIEGGAFMFRSTIPNLEDKPELWEEECPFVVGCGRVISAKNTDELSW